MWRNWILILLFAALGLRVWTFADRHLPKQVDIPTISASIQDESASPLGCTLIPQNYLVQFVSICVPQVNPLPLVFVEKEPALPDPPPRS